LYRKIHFLSATAGLTGHAPLAQMAAVFEALLFELIDRPGLLTPSALRTVAQTIDFVAELLSSPVPSATGSVEWRWPQILTVDDDLVSNRMVLQALRRARLPAVGTENPQTAWQWLQAQQYGVVLLDVEMPEMDGLELCRRLRALPGYRKTPVVLVTRHSDFESRAMGLMSGATDLVAKPFVAMELAAKVVMLLLKDRLGL
jgi:CheY-like chemotaxis protein